MLLWFFLIFDFHLFLFLLVHSVLVKFLSSFQVFFAFLIIWLFLKVIFSEVPLLILRFVLLLRLDVILFVGLSVGIKLKLFFLSTIFVIVFLITILTLVHLKILLAAGRSHFFVEVFRFVFILFLFPRFLFLRTHLPLKVSFHLKIVLILLAVHFVFGLLLSSKPLKLLLELYLVSSIMGSFSGLTLCHSNSCLKFAVVSILSFSAWLVLLCTESVLLEIDCDGSNDMTNLQKGIQPLNLLRFFDSLMLLRWLACF